MSDWIIERYTEADKDRWNQFVATSRNGTFLFNRNYMDYHSARFRDCSWIVRKGKKIRAVLPANLTEDGVLHSHQGLTYGGWITSVGHLDGGDLLDIFEAAIEIWRSEGIHELDYKPIPYIYSGMPADDDLYALYRLGAEQTASGLSVCINLREEVRYSDSRRWRLNKAAKERWKIEEVEDVRDFVELLTACLEERHDTLPVHTAEELQLLKERFPKEIRVFTLRLEDGHQESRLPDAGVCMYQAGRVAHTQYMCTSQRGRDMDLLTPLLDKLINDEYAGSDWFDFGICTEQNGLILNRGLLAQKSSYGGGGLVYPRFKLTF